MKRIGRNRIRTFAIAVLTVVALASCTSGTKAASTPTLVVHPPQYQKIKGTNGFDTSSWCDNGYRIIAIQQRQSIAITNHPDGKCPKS